MTLVEVLTAALLFGVSAGSSLRIWNLISVAVQEQEQQQQLADRLEQDLATLEAVLRVQSRRTISDIRPAVPPLTCPAAAAELQDWLRSRPVGVGVRRQLTLLPDGDGVLLELAIEGGPRRRQRLYHPAAHGLCPPAAAPEASVPLESLPANSGAPLPGPEAGGSASGAATTTVSAPSAGMTTESPAPLSSNGSGEIGHG